MSDIAPVTGSHGPALERLEPVTSRPSSAAPPRYPDRPSDRVELSDRARLLGKLASLPEMRYDLIERVREQIANGTYDTEEKLEAAVEALVQDLES